MFSKHIFLIQRLDAIKQCTASSFTKIKTRFCSLWVKGTTYWLTHLPDKQTNKHSHMYEYPNQ